LPAVTVRQIGAAGPGDWIIWTKPWRH